MKRSSLDKNTSLWESYIENVKPLSAPKLSLKKTSLKLSKIKHTKKETLPDLSSLTKKEAKKEIKLDPQMERTLCRGEIEIEAKLDLHGMTEAEAHKKLVRFITARFANDLRKLLVITGKGPKGSSVLRTNLPRWCETEPLSKVIRAVRPAALHHGAEGAYYVLLRKP